MVPVEEGKNVRLLPPLPCRMQNWELTNDPPPPPLTFDNPPTVELAYAALARRDPSGRHRAAPPPSARHLSAAPSSRDHPGSRPTSAPAHSSMSYSYSPPNPTWSRAPNPAESYARGSSDASSHGGRSPQVEYPRPRSSSDRMAPGTQLPPLASLFGGSPEWAGDEDGSGRKRLRRF